MKRPLLILTLAFAAGIATGVYISFPAGPLLIAAALVFALLLGFGRVGNLPKHGRPGPGRLVAGGLLLLIFLAGMAYVTVRQSAAQGTVTVLVEGPSSQGQEATIEGTIIWEADVREGRAAYIVRTQMINDSSATGLVLSCTKASVTQMIGHPAALTGWPSFIGSETRACGFPVCISDVRAAEGYPSYAAIIVPEYPYCSDLVDKLPVMAGYRLVQAGRFDTVGEPVGGGFPGRSEEPYQFSLVGLQGTYQGAGHHYLGGKYVGLAIKIAEGSGGLWVRLPAVIKPLEVIVVEVSQGDVADFVQNVPIGPSGYIFCV